jgi:DNA replication protein DnaC
MLNPATMDQLQQLKLTAMAAAWTGQQQDASCTQLSFDERFALLVQAEWMARENARVTRTLRAAKLKFGQACLEGIDYPARRELDKALIRQLATGRWIAEHQQLLVSGMTGTGKTYVACAFAQQACRQGYRARYWRAPRLFQACALARADGTYGRLLGQLARMDVLVIDDFALVPL